MLFSGAVGDTDNWASDRSFDALFKGRLCCFPKDPLEDVETWSESVDKVLGCKGASPL